MKIGDLLGTTFRCRCGREHSLALQAFVYEEDALARLPGLIAPHAKTRVVSMLTDTRTHGAAGKNVEHALRRAGWTVRVHILPDPPPGKPACDDATMRATLHRLGEPGDLLAAVGSGVINDLCKWISTDTGIPYLAVPTAASMNGYASANIAPTIRGVKCILRGTVPFAIVAVPSVIADAPFELTAAGLGDVLAKPVSITDWKINHLLFDEYYCPVCAHLIRDLEPLYLNDPQGIRDRKPKTVEALFSALVYSGIAMTMADTSFPASGGEHLISHVLDMTADLEGVAHDYHGRQVGVGTILAAALYDELVKIDLPRFEVHVEPTDRAFWGPLSDAVEEEHARKRVRARYAVTRLRDPGVWDRVRRIMRETTLGAAEIKNCLRQAGAAHRLADIGCPVERFTRAALRCHQIRERYTVIDLARAAGVLPTRLDEIVRRHLLD